MSKDYVQMFTDFETSKENSWFDSLVQKNAGQMRQ